VKMSLAERGKSGCKKHIEVKTRKLPSIIREFGLPFYCKNDVEGYTQSAWRLCNMQERYHRSYLFNLNVGNPRTLQKNRHYTLWTCFAR